MRSWQPVGVDEEACCAVHGTQETPRGQGRSSQQRQQAPRQTAHKASCLLHGSTIQQPGCSPDQHDSRGRSQPTPCSSGGSAALNSTAHSSPASEKAGSLTWQQTCSAPDPLMLQRDLVVKCHPHIGSRLAVLQGAEPVAFRVALVCDLSVISSSTATRTSSRLAVLQGPRNTRRRRAGVRGASSRAA